MMEEGRHKMLLNEIVRQVIQNPILQKKFVKEKGKDSTAMK